MKRKTYTVSDLNWANSFDSSNASVTPIAAPGAGFRIVIKRYKINVKTADDVIVLSGATEKDRHYLGDKGGYETDFGDTPMELGANEAFILQKTAATVMNWSITYATERV